MIRKTNALNLFLLPITSFGRNVMGATDFGEARKSSVASDDMIGIATATLLSIVQGMSGTPYIRGGSSPHGTDCSGLVSFVANAATGRPVYGSRFNTGNEEQALLARGFKYGTAPGALVVGWNGGHTAATLPDGTPVSSGEGGGVKVGGGGAYQPQFTHHMYLPMESEGEMLDAPPPFDPMAAPPPPPPGPGDIPVVDAGNFLPPPPPEDAPPIPA
jgi:hypothetical protein